MIIKKKKEKQYRQEILKHKKFILRGFFECIRCKDLEWIIQDPLILKELWNRILVHDDDKYEKDIFDAYRKHYFPVNQQEKKKNEKKFLIAKKKHIENNDHHWQSRINLKNEDFNIQTEIACLENLIDWLARGYQFNNRPYEYYEKHKDIINLPKKQIDFLEKCIYQGIDKDYIIKRRKNEKEKK